MPEFIQQLAPIHFPLIGNSVAVGLFSLLHIAFASLAVGFMVLAPFLESIGRTHPICVEVARGLTRFTVVTFTTSLVLAVIMIELIVGLFPLTNSWIFNQFRHPIGLAVAAFFLQTFTLYPYYHYWEPIRKRSRSGHILLGALAAFFILIWVTVLDGMGSYMLTPTQGFPLLNLTWIPLAAHRFFGNFVLGGFALAGYAAWMLGRRKSSVDESYYLLLLKTGFVIGLTALLVQPFTGLFYALRIRKGAPEAYAEILQGRYRGWVYLQFIWIALLFVGSYLLLRSVQPRKGGRLLGAATLFSALLMIAFVESPTPRRFFTFVLVGLTLFYIYQGKEALQRATMDQLGRAKVRRLAMALGVVSLLLYWTMGTIRETARRPDTVRGMISLQDEARSTEKVAEGSR